MTATRKTVCREQIPFFGVGIQYIRFAREEPALYRLLFLTQKQVPSYGAMDAMLHLQERVRPTLVQIYRITPEEADVYFRDLWLVVHSLATLIVTGDCPYSDPGNREHSDRLQSEHLQGNQGGPRLCGRNL